MIVIGSSQRHAAQQIEADLSIWFRVVDWLAFFGRLQALVVRICGNDKKTLNSSQSVDNQLAY